MPQDILVSRCSYLVSSITYPKFFSRYEIPDTIHVFQRLKLRSLRVLSKFP